MSRRSSSMDSLDLLLDTICNTFGGVLFIAILVVILLQLSGKQQSSEPRESISPDVYRQLQNRFATVTAELAELRKTTASQMALTADFAPNEIRDLIQRRRELNAERDQLQTKQDVLMAKNLATGEESAHIRATNANLQESLAEARRRKTVLETELKELRESRIRKTALPVTKTAFGKSEIGLVLRYGKMYVWHRYGRFGIRHGLNTDEFVVVDEVDGILVTTPKPNAGISLDDTDGMRRAIRARLDAFSPEENYISVIVRPDSFGHFQYLRDTLIGMGFKYRLMPVAEGDPVMDRGGSGGNVQ